MAKLKASQFKFKKNDTVGSEGAEQDRDFLSACYYDRGDLEAIRDCSRPNCIIVGRTGAGKTALLLKLQDEEERVINIRPEELSLQYLSNSTILPQVESLGINLGLFYKLLWRHILAVELVKGKYGLRTENDTKTFLQQIWSFLSRDREKEKAINYLLTWGQEFWKDTEYRVREVTTKLETDVKAMLGGALPYGFEASAGGERKRSVEEKADVIKRLQDVVNSIQVKELSRVIKILGESVFNSTQQRFYVLIDRLDEEWVDNHFRYRLIKALIETVKELNQHMKGVKVVVALRRDLLDRVIHETRDTGFQEEKYEPLYLNLKWNKVQLFGMLDKRVNQLVARQYRGGEVSWKDLMPKNVAKKQPTDEYLIERTMYRPRDIIIFFNLCMSQAVGHPEITAKMIAHAENEYSQRRLRSLYDEWQSEYPELPVCSGLLKNCPAHCRLDAIEGQAIADLCLSLAAREGGGVISEWATSVVDQKITAGEFRVRIASVFYRIGLIGLKTETWASVNWSFLHALTIPVAAIKDDNIMEICPVFYRVLGISPTNQPQDKS